MAIAATFKFGDNQFLALKIPEGMSISDQREDWTMQENHVYVRRFTYNEKVYIYARNILIDFDGPSSKRVPVFKHSGYIEEDVFFNRISIGPSNIDFSHFYTFPDIETIAAEDNDTLIGIYRTIAANKAYYYKLTYPYNNTNFPYFDLQLTPFDDGYPDLTDYPLATVDTLISIVNLLGNSTSFYDYFWNNTFINELSESEQDEIFNTIGEITLLLDHIHNNTTLNQLFNNYGVSNILNLNSEDWDIELSISAIDDAKTKKRKVERYARKLRNFIVSFHAVIDIQTKYIEVEDISPYEAYSLVAILPAILVREIDIQHRIGLLKTMLTDRNITENWNILPFLVPTTISPIIYAHTYDPADNEEAIILKIFESIDRDNTANVNAFLNALIIRNSPTDQTIFTRLYNEIDDNTFSIGEDNRQKLINQIYELWLVSDFNPYFNYNPVNSPTPEFEARMNQYTYGDEAPIILNFPTEAPGPILGYILNSLNIEGLRDQNFQFKYEGTETSIRIKVILHQSRWKLLSTDDQGNENYGFEYESTDYGIYDLFQPVNVLSIEPNETYVKLPKTSDGETTLLVPIFFMYYHQDRTDKELTEKFIGLLFDTILTFTGVGNLSKLRHIRHLSKIGQLLAGNLADDAIILTYEAIGGILATVEITAGITNAFLAFTTDDCMSADDPEFCQRMSRFLMILELASLSLDFLTRKALKKAARRVLDNPNGIPNGFNDAALTVLQQIARDLDELKAIFRSRFQLDNSQMNLLFNGLSESKQHQLLDDFLNAEFDDIMELLDNNADLVQYWDEIADLISARKSISYLKAYKAIKSNTNLLDHVHVGHPRIIPPTGNATISQARIAGFHNLNALRNPPPPPILPGEISWKIPPPVKNSNPTNPSLGYQQGSIQRNMNDLPDPNNSGNGWVNGQGISIKNKNNNVFFPESYSIQRINEEMAFALNKINVNNPNRININNLGEHSFTYKSFASDGHPIEIVSHSVNNNPQDAIIKTIYPETF